MEEVEYSDDHQFFLEHQLLITYTNNRKSMRFVSRLESKCFRAYDWNRPMSPREVEETAYKIWLEIPNKVNLDIPK